LFTRKEVTLHAIIRSCAISIVICAFCFHPGLTAPCFAGDKTVDICRMVSAAQLKQLYRKPLHATPRERGCYWSETPGGMAYMDIGIQKHQKDLRDYWNKNLSSNVKLEKITDLGDEGLMGIGEGTIGVVVIRKGNWILRSAVTFLDIEPGSKKHQVLWDIYRAILADL
jgi:hypothetical protein